MATTDKINILVVDDLPDKLLALQTVLEGLGENVVTARSGREALRRLLEHDFAVILLDVTMPDMDGLETAQMIRGRPRSAHTPIIFVTAFDDERQLARGYSLGAVDYILSPVPADILRTKVGVFVDLFRMTERVRRQAEERVALAREQAARAAAEEAARRLRFLAEAGAVLGQSLDADETLRALADLPVPFLADFAAVVHVQADGSWHTETAGGDLPAETEELVRRALAEGQSVGWVARPTGGEEAVGLATHPTSPAAGPTALALPLRPHGRSLGALVLAMRGSGRRYAAEDISLAEDLAGRAASAFENIRLYRDLQEQDHRKTEFLAMLAHELRNPLAPIRNAVQILRLGPADESGKAWANDVIDRQVKQMARLVDDLLDVSRITRGKVQLKTEPLDAATAVAAAVETSRPLIDARRHRLTVSLPQEPLLVTADPARLAQVLGNLLNNAAKYTVEGGRIDFAAAREGGEVVFRVRDTGVGIPAEMLPCVFDLFTQVERSLDRSEGGLGIGLTLVKRLVEMHSGRAEAFSAGPGQGSEFVVRLPALEDKETGRQGDKEQNKAPAEDASAPGNGPVSLSPCLPVSLSTAPAGLRVLVVDDNRDSAHSLALLMEGEGCVVKTAYDGSAALEAAEGFLPDIVLLDIGLPRLNGIEAARRLRALPFADPPLLVALTGYGHEEIRCQARAAGFDHHFVKPVDLDVLKAVLADRLRARPNGKPPSSFLAPAV